MLDGLIRFSLNHRLLVALIAAVIVVYGVVVLRALPIDVFPDLDRPTVTVLTEAGGLSPEEVELTVSRPIELAMNGAPGVQRVRSQSAVGLSVVWVEFGWNVEVLTARQQVSERLTRQSLPAGVTPMLGPTSSIMGEILLVGLFVPAPSPAAPSATALRTLADTELRPRLLAIPGVSQVVALGGGVEALQVEVRPEAMAARGVTLGDVQQAAASAQGNTTGGFLERNTQEALVRNLSRTADPAAIGATVVGRRAGASAWPVALRDVATVSRGVGVMRGDAGINGHPGVVLSVQKQSGASTLEVTAAVTAALASASIPAGVEVVPLFRQADFIEASVGNVVDALRDGAVLVTVVVLLFLLSWRTTAITLTAIPLSLLTSVIVLHAFGESVNTMTLGGLAVAIGELVDDAIVDVENVQRRLRENAASATPRAAIDVIFSASVEVRGSIVYSTALVVLVFVPLFALGGVEGRFFAPLGIAYITSIAASMLVSLTVTPAMCSALLSFPRGNDGAPEDGWLVRRLKMLDEAILSRVLPYPRRVLVAVAVAVLAAAASVPFLGSGFLPPFNEGTATINLLAAPGTSLTESNRLGTQAEDLILRSPEVLSTGRRTGRAEQDEHAEGVHYSEIDVDFSPTGRPRAEVLAEMRRHLALIPGLSVNVGQPIGHRLDHLLSGVRAQLVVKLFGEDLAILRTEAERLRVALSAVPGVVDLAVERQVLAPQVQVQLDRERALRFGMAPGALAESLETALAGRRVGQVFEGLRPLDIVVRYQPSSRDDVDRIRNAPISLEDGHVITIGQVADVRPGTGPNEVLHENGRRRIVLSANTAGRDVGSVARDVEAALANAGAADGVTVSLEGQFERQQSATRTISALSALSLLGMVAVLYGHFGSARITALVLLNIPLALVGAVAALWATGQPLSVATMVGFVTLCGIASRNTILMVAHYRHLRDHEGVPPGPGLVIRGSLERLVPVLMTALSAGIALVPLALSGGAPGKEILTPVAQVILGGLASATLLDLLVTPTVYLWLGDDGAAPVDRA
jgi:CzcA family heavy metal efflux pump